MLKIKTIVFHKRHVYWLAAEFIALANGGNEPISASLATAAESTSPEAHGEAAWRRARRSWRRRPINSPLYSEDV